MITNLSYYNYNQCVFIHPRDEYGLVKSEVRVRELWAFKTNSKLPRVVVSPDVDVG